MSQSRRDIDRHHQLIVDGYVRVSTVREREGPSFISPDVQREQIEAWTKLNGARLGTVFEELNESGGRADRPKLLEAIERIESGASQGLVVAKLDRFGRSLVDSLSKIDRISAAGGIFVSVSDGLDLSTPTGKLILRIMLSMAEWELDRIRANWDIARLRAVERGVFLGGVTPFGYVRTASGRLRPDPEAAPWVARMFAARAAGATHREVADLLDESGLPTAKGSSHFTEATVNNMIRNRVYLGEVKVRDHVNVEAHQPLIDLATWQRAQRLTHCPSHAKASLLGGILRCGTCRMKMASCHGAKRGRMARPVYQCQRNSSAGVCPDPARVRADEIEGLFEEFAFRALRRAPDPRAAARAGAAAARLAEAERALAVYRDDTSARSTLGSERFAAGLAKRLAEVDRRALALANARIAGEPAEVPEDIETLWPKLDLDGRREVLEKLVDCAFLMPGTGPAQERVHICRRGEEPLDLPVRGRPIGRLIPFDPASVRAASLPKPALWSETRIERELLAWRGGQTVWPGYAEFLRDGRARLYLQVLEWGGHIYWSRKLGWEAPPLRRHHWNHERVRGALRPYLQGRDMFPRAWEFEELGARQIREAAQRTGGIGHWAAEFGVGYRDHKVRRRGVGG
jgi:site-specific DNA recombinase